MNINFDILSPSTAIISLVSILAIITTAIFLKRGVKQEKPILSSLSRKPKVQLPRASFDDEYLSGKRQKTLYNHLRYSLNWFRRKKKPCFGDGLDSIFIPSDSQTIAEPIDIQNLNEYSAETDADFIRHALEKLEIFAARSEVLLERMCSVATRKTIKNGEFVYKQGDSTYNHVFIIKSGECAMERCDDDVLDPTIVADVVGGDVIGGMVDMLAYFTGTSMSKCASIRCMSDECDYFEIASLVVDNDDDGGLQYKQRFFKSEISSIVHCLLTRLNRVAMMTAYRDIGLLHEVPPPIQMLNLPGLENIDFRLLSSMTKLNDRTGLMIRQSFATGLDIDVNEVPNVVINQKEDEEKLMSCLQLFELTPGQFLDEVSPDAALYLVLVGELEAYVQEDLSRLESLASERLGKSIPMAVLYNARVAFSFQPGSLIGQMAITTGSFDEWYGSTKCRSSFLRVMASKKNQENCWVVRLAKDTFESILSRNPDVIIRYAKRIISSLPTILHLFDSAMIWHKISAGDTLVAEGDVPCSLYVVIHGRLRSFVSHKSSCKVSVEAPFSLVGIDSETQSVDLREMEGNAIVTTAEGRAVCRVAAAASHADRPDSPAISSTTPAERLDSVCDYTKGCLIGDVELLRGGMYSSTIKALRNCLVASIQDKLLAYVIKKYSSVMIHLARQVAKKSQMSSDRKNVALFSSPKVITVFPISGSTPMDMFLTILTNSMQSTSLTRVRAVSSAELSSAIAGFDKLFASAPVPTDGQILTSKDLARPKFMSQLSMIEAWMQQVEEQSDVVIYKAEMWNGKWNELCCNMSDLVMLVGNANDSPLITESEHALSAILERLPKALILLHVDPPSSYKPHGTRQWIEYRKGIHFHHHCRLHTSRLDFDSHHYKSDFCRLARILTGQAVGIVLGGGGARGMSHLGLIRAMEECEIPIDMIGGTSIGALIGGLYCSDDSYLSIIGRARKFCNHMSSIWTYLLDVTLPVTSYFNGYGFCVGLKTAIGDTKIEDLWIPFFCVTTDLSSCREKHHFNGTLWRYVRASMSLAGFLPPVCDVDPKTGIVHYLVDGGYVNNLPADVMKQMYGNGKIFAVDVSGDWEMTGSNYGDWVNGFDIILNKLLFFLPYRPFSAKISKVPQMTEISTQLAYISALKQLEEAKKKFIDVYILPDLRHKFSTLQFSKYSEIEEIGYLYAITALKEYKDCESKRADVSVGASVPARKNQRAPNGASDVAMRRVRSVASAISF